MISFCDGKYTTHKDRYQWVLTEHYAGLDKDGNEKQHSRETYHSNIEQVCRTILNNEAGACEDATQIIELFSHAVERLAAKSEAVR